MSIIDDFQDIVSRMKGELKSPPVRPEPEKATERPHCIPCYGAGLINGMPCGRCYGSGFEP